MSAAPLTGPTATTLPMTVAIVGTGYVGLVTGACLAEAGHKVTCIDRDAARVEAIRRGETPIHEDGLPELLSRNLAAGRLTATADTGAGVTAADVVLIAVGTPSREGGSIDLGPVERAAGEIGAALSGGGDGYPVVAVKSTVVPGTTDTLVRRALERHSGRRVGQDLGLAMNPEFLSQGSAVQDFLAADRIVVGTSDSRSGDVMAALYRPFPAPLLRLSLREAELTKYAANGLQATLISFANQFATLCEAVPGIDHRRVLAAVHLDRMLDGPDGERAAATRFLMGGVGFGGSCFAKDLIALSSWARRRGVDLPMIDAVLAVNCQRSERVIDLLAGAIGGLCEKRVAVLGLAFKPGTDDLRDSPGVKLAHRLTARGVEVRAHDPLQAVRRRARQVFDTAILVADEAAQVLDGADAALIATAWPEYRSMDWAALAARMRKKVVLDGRFLLTGLDLPPGLRLVPVGAGLDEIGLDREEGDKPREDA
jgi:UDPglucose 6-dehydrogenase